MSAYPTIFDTTGADPSTLAQMSQMVANSINNGQAFKVIGPNGLQVTQNAQQIESTTPGVVINPGPNTTPPTVPAPVSPANQVASGFMMGSGAAVGAYPSQATQTAVSQSGASLFSWLNPSSWGNFGLIVFGAALGLGALLISQKETIIKVGDTAAKGAALL